jgi:hypothetical protein
MCVIGRTLRFIAGVVFAVSVLAAVGGNAANAQQSQTPAASAFLANPGQLLQQYPNGGALLITAVQQLALADPSTFKVLIGLLANANDQQKGAIGEGLTKAAKVKVLTDQALAEDWQQQIAAITDPTFKTAATNALGDVRLGAVGGAAGGDAAAGLGGPGSGPAGGGALQDIRSNAVNTPSFTFTGSTTAGPGFTSARSSTSVSP